jgi:Fe2+ transport system protein FeoA
MKILAEVEPEVKVTVKEIGGGSEVKGNLADLGISKGTELTVVATEPVHVHAGPIALNVTAGREAVIARGWADKVYVEKGGETLPLLQLENGDKGTLLCSK